FDNALHMAEDWDLYLRLAQAACPMAWTRTLVCHYRQHAGSSIRDLDLHCDSSLRVLDKFFGQPGVDPALAALAPPATAWVYVLLARRALQNSQAGLAKVWLAQAIALDRQLDGSRKAELIEFLLSPTPGQGATPSQLSAALRQHQPETLALSA